MARPSGRDLRTELLTHATAAMQTSGASFSYQRLAERLGVRAPSLHHHFRRKDDLVVAATERYIEAFERELAAVEATTAPERLTAFIELFVEPAASGRLCLCGALAADWESVDAGSRALVTGFFDTQVGWVRGVATAGVDAGELRSDLNPETFAQMLVDALEGALLLARADGRSDPGAPARDLVRLACA